MKSFFALLPLHLSVLRGRRVTIHGIRVVIQRDSAEKMSSCLQKTEAALDLLSRYDRAALREMAVRFSAIFIWFGPGAATGLYRPELRLCELNSDIIGLERVSHVKVAMVLVHELAHARMRPVTHGVVRGLAHEEWLCTSAEIAFAKKVPGSTRELREAKARLARRPEFYSPDAVRERQHEHIRSIEGWPWLERLTNWYLRRVERRSARGKQRGGDPRPRTNCCS